MSQPTKSRRQRMIADWLRGSRIGSQDEIVARLSSEGVSATQATVSRDLDELGAVRIRRGGDIYYALGEQVDAGLAAARLDQLLADWVDSIAIAGNMLVLKTPPGSANLVANALDVAQIAEIIGTIAGDDTIFVALAHGVNAAGAAERLRARRSGA